jgi:O-succinylbenzoate synthase
VVESNSSNCIVAVPKVCGVARRTRAWLRKKVNALEESCRTTREETDVSDVASKFGEGVGVAWRWSVVDIDFVAKRRWDSEKAGP